jgi:hypothetical protein
MHPTVFAPVVRRAGSRPLWLALVALAAVAAPAAADVYKWVDASGNIHYTDRPPPSDAKLLSVETGAGTHGPHVVPAPAPAAAAPANGAVPLPAPNAQEAARLKKGVDADLASTHAEQCKSAQERYQKYINSRRIFREGANNERVYLSDAEADAERVNARREVEELCGDSTHL